MPKTVKYIGTVTRWPELATTGKQSTWVPGQQEQRSDTEAAQLLATGLFSDVDATQLPEQKVVAISGVVSGDGPPLASRTLVHRASPFTFPEGSLSGLRAMYAAGFRRFEIDCLLTADNKLVWMHDTTVQRTCSGIGTASGATTNAAGYASGVGTVTLASAGTGSIKVGDKVRFGTDTTSYTVTSGDADVAGGGSISFTPNLVAAIPASATAITVGEVAAYTATEFKALALSNLVGSASGYQPEAPSLLTEVLDWASDKLADICFEAKSPNSGGVMRAILAELRTRNWPRSRCSFTSFVKATADIAVADGWRAYHQPSGTLTTGEVDTAISGGYIGIFGNYAEWTQLLVDRAKAGGLETAAYTVNRRKYRDQMLAIGVDTIVSDDPVYMAHTAPITRGDMWSSRKFTPGMIGSANTNPLAVDTQRGQWFANGNWGFPTGSTFVGALVGASCPITGDALARSGDIRVAFIARTRVASTSWAGMTIGLGDDGRDQEAVAGYPGSIRIIYRQNRQIVASVLDASGNGSAVVSGGTGVDLNVGQQYWMRAQWFDNGNGTSTLNCWLYDTNGTTEITAISRADAPLIAGGYFVLCRKDIAAEFIPGTLSAT